MAIFRTARKRGERATPSVRHHRGAFAVGQLVAALFGAITLISETSVVNAQPGCAPSAAFCETFDQGPSAVRLGGGLDPSRWAVGRRVPSGFSPGALPRDGAAFTGQGFPVPQAPTNLRLIQSTGGFDPCPTTGPCKILPLGDSITEAQFGGYRVELFRLAVQAGKQITFVGSGANGPTQVGGQPFPRNHEGHSGWVISQIDNIIPSPALDVHPHVILLHIGTNDIWSMPSGAPQRLATLLDQIIEAAPNTLLAVARVIPFPQYADRVTTFNTALTSVVEERISAGKHLILVDQFTGFPPSDLFDGIHPNDAGNARMGAVWFSAISSYLH